MLLPVAFVLGIVLAAVFTTIGVVLLELFGFLVGGWLCVLLFCAGYLLHRSFLRFIGDPLDVYDAERRSFRR